MYLKPNVLMLMAIIFFFSSVHVKQFYWRSWNKLFSQGERWIEIVVASVNLTFFSLLCASKNKFNGRENASISRAKKFSHEKKNKLKEEEEEKRIQLTRLFSWYLIFSMVLTTEVHCNLWCVQQTNI